MKKFFLSLLLFLVSGCSGGLTDGVSLEQVLIPTGTDVYHPGQDFAFDLDMAQGHTLLYLFEKKTLVYDGKVILIGDLNGFSLSRNGEHFTYVLRGNDNSASRLFIDDRKVFSALSLSDPKVSDDGEHFFFLSSEKSFDSPSRLMKDGELLFEHKDGVVQYWISSDGAAYVVSLRHLGDAGSFRQSLVRDGEEIAKGNELKFVAVSRNTQHIAYVVSSGDGVELEKMVVDGKTVLEGANLLFPVVNDSGNYSFVSSLGGKAVTYLNDQVVTTGNGAVPLSLNEDGSHMVAYTDEGLFVDGNMVQLDSLPEESRVWTQEVLGNTVYVYVVAR